MLSRWCDAYQAKNRVVLVLWNNATAGCIPVALIAPNVTNVVIPWLGLTCRP